MALKLKRSLANGVDAEYWKIVEMNIFAIPTSGNASVRAVHVKLRGYINKGARQSGKSHVEEMTFIFTGSDCPDMTVSEPYVVVYTKIKTLPEWAGAIDDQP